MNAVTHESYESTCPSDVAWAGNVPGHWNVQRLGRLFRESSQRASTPWELSSAILSVSIHDGISDKEIDEDELDRKVTRSDDRSLYKVVRENDLAYNMMRAWQGGFGAAQVNGLVSPAYVVCKPRTSFPSRFFELLLRTPTAVSELKRFSRGITDFRLRLYWDDFKRIEVPVPPENEQRQILAFLDYETAKIDALIEKQQQLIALLGEKRQAVISHAVTKGLNPDAPMRDSNVEWLGQVPEHWKVLSTCRVCDLTTGERDTQDAVPDGKYPFFVRSDNVERINTYSFDGEGVLTSGDGAGVGKIFHHFKGRFEFHQRVYLFHNFKEITGRFFFYFLREHLAIVALAGNAKSTVDSLRRPMLRMFPVCLPPIEEQEAITQYLDEKVERIDALISVQDDFRDLLQERRTALISAAVTGKIDVRGWKRPTADRALDAEIELA